MIMIAARKLSMPHSFPQDPRYENNFYASDRDQQKLRNSMWPRWQRLEHREQYDHNL